MGDYFKDLTSQEQILLQEVLNSFRHRVQRVTSSELQQVLQPLFDKINTAKEVLDKIVRNEEYGLEVRMLASDARKRIREI